MGLTPEDLEKVSDIFISIVEKTGDYVLDEFFQIGNKCILTFKDKDNNEYMIKMTITNFEKYN